MPPTIYNKRGTQQALASVNPVLGSGELCLETDTNRIKFGDGVTAWNSLNYAIISNSGTIINYPSISEATIVNSSGNFNNLSVNNTQVSVSGHTHTSSNITDFNSSVSGLFPSNIVTGTGLANHVAYWSNSGIVSADSGQLYWDSTNNRLGIGTSTPTTSVEIDGALKFVNCDTRIVRGDNGSVSLSGVGNNVGHFGLYIDNRSTAGGRLYRIASHSDGTTGGFRIRDDSSGADRLTITSAGNVGIGTTTPVSSLDVTGAVKIGGYSDAVPGSGSELVISNVSSVVGTTNSNNAGIVLQSNGNNTVYIRSNPTNLRIGNNGGDRFTITHSNGNIGIGTTTPSGRLHVAGTGIFNNIAIGGTTTTINGTAFSMFVNGDVILGSGNANRALVVCGNNTSNKRTVLKNVNGDSVLSFTVGNQNLSFGETGNRFNNINYYAGASSAGLHRFFVSNDSTPEVVIGSGFLGIGTTTPSGRLHVAGGSGLFSSVTSAVTPNALLHAYSAISGDTVFNVEGTNGSLFSVIDSLSGSLMSVNNNAGLPIFEVFSDDSIVAGRYNLNDFVISSSGNVGIGSVPTSHKIQVSGNMAVSGLIISTSGNYINSLQVNGTNVSISGHTHTSSNITDFNSSVSGLLPTIANSGDNRVLTSTGTTTGTNAESNLTFDGSTLNIDGNLVFDSFTESVIAIGNSSTSQTLSIGSGTVQTCTLTGNCTFTMPSLVAGKSFTLFLNTGAGNYTASFSGVLWSDSAPITVTTIANKVDILSFISDGSYWYGSYSQNYG